MYIGLSSPEDQNDLRKLYKAAFDDTDAFMDYYFDHKVVFNKVAMIKEDNALVAMMHMNPFVVQFNGMPYHVSYFVAVATDQSYRKRGYMGKLMAFALRKLYEDGEVFSLLMPIDSRIYERYGFGFMEDHLHFDCISDTLVIDKVTSVHKVATEDDVDLLLGIYQTFTEKLELTTCRDTISFEKLYKELKTDDAKIILFENGYLMTFYQEDVLNVREFVANSDHTFKEMINYIKDVSNGGRIVIYDHIRSKIKHFLPNIPENKVILKPFMMARIINVLKFIEMNIDLFEDCTIKVMDADLAENNHCYQIKANKVNMIHEDVYDVAMDIKTFTQLVFGYIHEVEIEDLNHENHFNNRKALIKSSKPKAHFFNEYV